MHLTHTRTSAPDPCFPAANERAIPAYPSRFDVQRYGAVGDGEADDTASFLAAIKAAQQAASRLSRVRALLPHTAVSVRWCHMQGVLQQGLRNALQHGLQQVSTHACDPWHLVLLTT